MFVFAVWSEVGDLDFTASLSLALGPRRGRGSRVRARHSPSYITFLAHTGHSRTRVVTDTLVYLHSTMRARTVALGHHGPRNRSARLRVPAAHPWLAHLPRLPVRQGGRAGAKQQPRLCLSNLGAHLLAAGRLRCRRVAREELVRHPREQGRRLRRAEPVGQLRAISSLIHEARGGCFSRAEASPAAP